MMKQISSKVWGIVIPNGIRITVKAEDEKIATKKMEVFKKSYAKTKRGGEKK